MNEKEKEGAFSIVFDQEGNPIDIIPGIGCKVVADESATSDSLKKILDLIKENYREAKVRTVGCHLLHVYNSPGCYILTASGRLKCICCG
ncbi:hypothetical protein [Desulfosarcina sp.]|uniref:hypothetical protein n=1 Tax=Desulfosarcina sp. TaxID=2027861 RepID=UPI003970D463